ncbi:hypothetical protein THAOC_26600 [Thalassiosira oceanica]|uniref:Uncharacterized protein n=1 Tax=Thalassiosira oceanica TaxID=159749 RepID=K0RJK3_THAOC|nr:hypothetical protein THAOC_26600 [Thalassiosira oceanica]|eukprot:EJK53878.1 hypothetical protein THAOC_26600 [Thalassiosira oceanica]
MADGPTSPGDSDLLLLLLSRSSSLLHGIDGVDWPSVLDPPTDGVMDPSAVPGGGDDGGSDDSDSDGDSDSSSDGGGGC